MNRRSSLTMRRLTLLATASIALLACSGCGSLSLKFWCWGCDSGDDKEDEARVHHIVLVWLKLPGNPTHRQQVIDAAEEFDDIPGVRKVSAGRSMLSERDIVDDSFDVAIVLSFDDKYDLQAYLEHPDHQEAVKETLEPLVDHLVVYDFIEPFH